MLIKFDYISRETCNLILQSPSEPKCVSSLWLRKVKSKIIKSTEMIIAIDCLIQLLLNYLKGTDVDSNDISKSLKVNDHM